MRGLVVGAGIALAIVGTGCGGDCTFNSQCPERHSCIAGQCVMGCSSDDECVAENGSGSRCSPFGVCSPGRDAGPGRDAQVDAAGMDAAIDAGDEVDGGLDAETPIDAPIEIDAPMALDAGLDAGADGGVDGGADAGIDGGQDAGRDSGLDAGLDGGQDAGPPPICMPRLVINEVDYDNIGTDSVEFVEIYNASSSTISLTGVSLVLVNGADSTVYRTINLAMAGADLAAGAYLVVAPSAVTTPAGTLRVAFPGTSDQIQNGPPDGLAVMMGSTLIDALSYEGSITAVTLAGSTRSLVEMTPTTATDSNTVVGTLARIPSGCDTDLASRDWRFSSTPTPGEANR